MKKLPWAVCIVLFEELSFFFFLGYELHRLWLCIL